MDFDDLFDEVLNGDAYQLFEEQLELEQPLISKKEIQNFYSVDRNYINSKAFHDKFERLPVNRNVQQALYIQAGRLLNFVDGQEQERMLAINARTGEFLADNFDREGSIRGTEFQENEIKMICKCKDDIIVMHNHSLNGRPSAQDILTYLHEPRVKLSVICCHDGTVYGICGVNEKAEIAYNDLLKQAKLQTADNDEAKCLATTALYLMNDKSGIRDALFDVRRW